MKVPDEWAPPPNKEYAPGVMIISLTVPFYVSWCLL